MRLTCPSVVQRVFKLGASPHFIGARRFSIRQGPQIHTLYHQPYYHRSGYNQRYNIHSRRGYSCSMAPSANSVAIIGLCSSPSCPSRSAVAQPSANLLYLQVLVRVGSRLQNISSPSVSLPLYLKPSPMSVVSGHPTMLQSTPLVSIPG